MEEDGGKSPDTIMSMIAQLRACERERDEHLRQAAKLDRTIKVLEMLLGGFYDRIMGDDDLLDGQP